MATSYSTLLKLALPTQGEISGTWGTVINENITSMIEEAIAVSATINTWSGNAATLSTADGTTAEARAAILNLTDSSTSLSGAASLVCPTLTKTYLIKNGTAQTVTLKTASGTGIAVPTGKSMWLYCDGTNVVEGVNHVAGALTVAGAITGSSTLQGTTITATTAVVPDASGGADLGTTSLEWGDIFIADDKKIKFGSGQDVSMEYDEDGTDTLLITGDVTIADGTNDFDIASHDGSNGLKLGGTLVASTAAELNILDGGTGASAITLADADRIVVNDNGTMKQVALTAFETYFESVLDTLSVTSVGALDSGSITSGFGTIDTGASTITTTGAITGGSLTADDVAVNGKVITMTGSASDTAVFTAGTDGTLTIVTTDAAAAAANITITADGTAELAGTTVTLNSAGAINLTATTDVVVPANVGVTFGTGEKIEGDSTDLTVTSGGAINLTATTDIVVPANVGVTFGTGEKIEGDSTDLTVTSGADINLTATSDVNIPANVGVTFGNDGEKIEGDGTNLAINSSGDVNITATTADLDGNLEVSGTTAQVGVLTTTATQVATGGITSGSDIVSDTDSTDDLGTTSVRWANLFVDGITATDQITATGFTGTLDGILGSGAAAAATVTTLDTSGAVNLNLTTDSTSSTSGALIVDGGVGIAKKLFVGTDLDVDGTANLDVVDIDGAVNLGGTLTIGDSGYFIGNATNGIRFNSSDNSVNLLKILDDGSIQTVTAGTSNVRLGLNAGNNIEAGGNYNVAIGDEAGTAITTGDHNAAVGFSALKANQTASFNTAVGSNSLLVNSTGARNTAVGYNSLTANTEAADNTAVGHYAMGVNSTGTQNTAVGSYSLDANTTASYNTALGGAALGANTSGAYNTAVGYAALGANDTGANNTAVGTHALWVSETGANNTAVGQASLKNNTGANNTAVGYQALLTNTSAANNVAVGYTALKTNSTGAGNVGVGYNALTSTTAANNTAVGYRAMDTNSVGTANTAVGYLAAFALTEGSSNVVIGAGAGSTLTTGDNNSMIGKESGITGSPGGNQTTGDNEIFLGDENITASNIQVDWTVASDQRDKTDFTALDVGLSFVNALEPVTYKWDKRSKYIDKTDPDVDLDTVTHDGTHKEDWLDIGFKAQAVEVLEIAAGYKIADKTNLTTSLTSDGKQYGIQYSKFVPILVKALQELSDQNDALEARIAALEA